MIGQAPPSDLSVDMDCNGNTLKDKPDANQLHPMNKCPELSKLLQTPPVCPDQQNGVAAVLQQPVMPSVVAGSVEGNVTRMTTLGLGESGRLANGDQTVTHPDRISRRKTRPIRGRRINYLFEMLESMKHVEAVPKAKGTSTNSDLANLDEKVNSNLPTGPDDLASHDNQATNCVKSPKVSPDDPPSPEDPPHTDLSSFDGLLMVCEGEDLEETQMGEKKAHLAAMERYKKEMETYLEEMEKFFLEKHGFNKKKKVPSVEGSKSGPDEIVMISRGTQASPPKPETTIGPAIELDLSEEGPKESGESCYTRELEALTNSLPSASPLKIPTTQTKMHLGHSAPKNRFCRTLGDYDADSLTQQYPIVSALLDQPSSLRSSKPSSPSKSPDDPGDSGLDISPGPDGIMAESGIDCDSGTRQSKKVRDKHIKNKKVIVNGGMDMTNACTNTKHSRKKSDVPDMLETPKTHKHLKVNRGAHGSTVETMNTSCHVTPSNAYPFVNTSGNAYCHVTPSSNRPFVNVGEVVSPGYPMVSSSKYPLAHNGGKVQAECQVTQSDKHAGKGQLSKHTPTNTNNTPNTPNHGVPPPINPHGYQHGLHQVGNLPRFGTPTHPGGGLHEGNYMQPVSGNPSMSHGSSSQRIPSYGIHQPQYRYMHHPGMYSHQNPYGASYSSVPRQERPPHRVPGYQATENSSAGNPRMSSPQDPHGTNYPPAMHPTREAHSSGGIPPNRRRSSSGNRVPRHPSGDAPQAMGGPAQPKETANGSTYHYRQDESVAAHFEKTYQEIASRKSKEPCPNVSVQHPWQPFTATSQPLQPRFFPGTWPYSQQLSMQHMAMYQTAINNIYGSNSGGSRPNFSPTVQNQGRLRNPPAYRPTEMSQHQPQFRASGPVQQRQPLQQTKVHSKPPGNVSSTNPVPPVEHPMQPYMRFPVGYGPHEKESPYGQPSLMRSNHVPPLIQVQQQKRDASQRRSVDGQGIHHVSPSQQMPSGGLEAHHVSTPGPTLTDQVASNTQRAAAPAGSQTTMPSKQQASPPQPFIPVVPRVIPSASKQQDRLPEGGPLDLSHQQPVMPQITHVRSHGEPHGSPNQTGTTPQESSQEPVMPKIVMVQTEKPGPVSEESRLFSKSLERMASSRSGNTLNGQQVYPMPQSGAHFTASSEKIPSQPGPSTLDTSDPPMPLGDQINNLVEHYVKSNDILTVPNFRERQRNYQQENIPMTDHHRLPESEPTLTSSHKGKDSKGKDSKGKHKSKSHKKKRKEHKAPTVRSPNAETVNNPGIPATQPIDPFSHVLKIPDVTKVLSVLDASKNTSTVAVRDGDLAKQLSKVPSEPYSSLQATQEWVNKQFASAAYQLAQAPDTIEAMPPNSDGKSSTPVLSSLLSQPVQSYGPSPFIQEGTTPSNGLTASLPDSNPNPAATVAHPMSNAPPTAGSASSEVKEIGRYAEKTSPPVKNPDPATKSTTCCQAKAIENHESLSMESINSLVDIWEEQSGEKDILARAANAAGITDSEEEEIVIAVPFSEAEPTTQGKPTTTGDESYGQEGNIFDRLGSYISDLEKSPTKTKDDDDAAQEKWSTPEDHKKDVPEVNQAPSGRLKNCTLRLVPRKRKADDETNSFTSNNFHHRIMYSDITSETSYHSPNGVKRRISHCKDGKNGSASYAKRNDKTDATHQDISGKNRRTDDKHDSFRKADNNRHTSSSHKSGSKHSSSHEKRSKHSSSHQKTKDKKASHKSGHHQREDKKHSSHHRVDQTASSRTEEGKKPSIPDKPDDKTTSFKDDCKVDKYYGYKRGSLPQHEHNTRFRIVCSHCDEMMADNVAYMEHLEAVIEKSIPASRVKQLCKVCLKAQPKDLLKHIQKLHLDGGKFICKICNLNFHARKDLKFHMKKIHKGLSMPYVCKICLFQTSFHSDLKYHFTSRHRGTKALLCHFCTKILYSSRSYLAHFTKHFAKESGVSCSDCVLMFLNNTSHKEHLSSDHQQLEWTEKDGLPEYYEFPDLRALTLDAAERRRNAYTASSNSEFAQIGDCEVDSTLEELWKCLECGGLYAHLAEHLITEYKCQSCCYFTQCSSAYTQHVVSFHSSFQDPPIPHPVKKTTVFGGQLLRCKKCGYKTSYATNMAKHIVCCPEGVSVVDSFDYLRQRALKEIALRERLEKTTRDRAQDQEVVVIAID